MNVVADSLRSAVPSSNGTESSRPSYVARQRVATIVNQLVTSSPAGSLVTRDYRCHTFTSKPICRDLHRLPAPDASKRTFPHEVPAPLPAAETTDARTCHEQWLDRQRRHLAGRRRHAAGLATFLPQRPHPRPQDRTPERRILYGCQRSFGRGPRSAVSPHVGEIRPSPRRRPSCGPAPDVRSVASSPADSTGVARFGTRPIRAVAHRSVLSMMHSSRNDGGFDDEDRI